MKVLISGAGIAGLTLARRLRALKIEFTLIEKQSEPHVTGAGIALPANAVKALRYLGFGEKIEECAHKVRQIIYAKPSGEDISRASLEYPPLNTDLFVALERKQLHSILIDGLEETIHYGTHIISLNNNGDKNNVVFNHSKIVETEYDLVVAADGINSGVRKLTFAEKDNLVDLDVTNWRFTVDYPTENIQPSYSFGDTESKLFMVYPIGPNKIYCYAHIEDPNSAYLKCDGSITMLKEIFAEFHGLPQEVLSSTVEKTPIITGRLRSVPTPYFYSKQVAFVGDAANACSPLLQQGAASAFEDVITLSEMLANFPVDRALEHYREYREPRVKWILEASDDPFRLMAKINNSFGYWWGSTIRNGMIYLKGPLNVYGWKQLLRTNPLDGLAAFIKHKKESEENYNIDLESSLRNVC